jgi:hypothetical protein
MKNKILIVVKKYYDQACSEGDIVLARVLVNIIKEIKDIDGV